MRNFLTFLSVDPLVYKKIQHLNLINNSIISVNYSIQLSLLTAARTTDLLRVALLKGQPRCSRKKGVLQGDCRVM